MQMSPPLRNLPSAASAPHYIFFCGTLMRGFPLRERSGIDGWIRFAGYGAVGGGLFDLGPYPGLVEAGGDYRRHVALRRAAGSLL